MKKYCLVFEYDSKKFMDVNKIIEFKKNLEKVEQAGNEIKLVFYGNGSNEEFATFMGYFNRLAQSKVCDFSISFTTKDLVIENGINNKAIKKSSEKAQEIKNNQFGNIIKEYYNEDVEIKVLPTKDWETLILDIIGE